MLKPSVKDRAEPDRLRARSALPSPEARATKHTANAQTRTRTAPPRPYQMHRFGESQQKDTEIAALLKKHHPDLYAELSKQTKSERKKQS